MPQGSGPFRFHSRSAMALIRDRSLTTRCRYAPACAQGASCKFADVAQLAERDSSKVEVTSSRLVIRSTILDVAQWSKASGRKPEGASPRPFESDRPVQALPSVWRSWERA